MTREIYKAKHTGNLLELDYEDGGVGVFYDLDENRKRKWRKHYTKNLYRTCIQTF